MEWQFLAADLLPDQLWVIASIHFQNTPIHPSPEEKGKKKPFHQPMRVGCGSQCQGSTHLSVFEFSISNSSLKKKSESSQFIITSFN